jgi:hypothetical protein
MRIEIPPIANEIIDKVLNDLISMLYNSKQVPRSFIFDLGVRNVIRERMKQMMINSAIHDLITTKNMQEYVKTSIESIDNIRAIMLGYLLAFYDLTKDR